MENKKFCWGMLVMVLVFGMAVIGCDDGSNSSKPGLLDGTWNKSPYQLIISGTGWTMKYSGTNYSKGTGTINETATTFTVITTHAWQNNNAWVAIPQGQSLYTATVQYNLSGNTLTLSNNTNETNMPMNGTWTK